jgi:hypothetical protein
MEGAQSNKAWRRKLLLTACLSVPAAAQAADNGVYIGLGSAEVSPDFDVDALTLDAGDGNGLKAIAGFRPVDSFAIEANYVDFDAHVPLANACVAAPCAAEASIDSRLVSVSAVGLWALPLVDVYARVGVTRWESEQSLAPEDRSGRDPTYGAGAQVRVGSFALRMEYERFDFDDDSADLVSVGFTYTFF